jgi:hypothetical protein
MNCLYQNLSNTYGHSKVALKIANYYEVCPIVAIIQHLEY